jgi:GT2 family glycosyltransferase
MEIALIVPVLNRFDLFTKLMKTVDENVRVFVIESYENNRGVAGSWNEGMRRAQEAGYRYAIITNDDVEFHPGSIMSMYKSIKHSNACLVSACQHGQVGYNGVIPGADFCCFAIDIHQLLDKVGTFDENFFPAYYEDNDMHKRMILAGVETLIDMGAPIVHHKSQTQNFDPNNPVTTPQMFTHNRAYYEEKWGGTPMSEAYETPFNNPDWSFKHWEKR